MLKKLLKNILISILTALAKATLRRHKPKIIAITGSVGKTSTKDAVYEAIKDHVSVRANEKSFNSEIGVPLTILGLQNAWSDPVAWVKNIFLGIVRIFSKKDYPEWLILEVGADRPGDIEKTMRWIHPDISIVTRTGEVPVHVEFYPSPAEVAYEKSWLVRGLKNDGLAILNADDERVLAMKELTKARVVTFGRSSEAEIQATHETILYGENKLPCGMAFRVQIRGTSIPISLKGTIGGQQVNPTLAAVAVMQHLGINVLEGTQMLERYSSPKGRMKIIPGIHGSCIIDDSYNSSPAALEAGMKALDDVDAPGLKIGVLGDMLELGRHSISEHERLGRIAAIIFDQIVCVGIRARDFSKGAKAAKFRKKIQCFDTSGEAGEFLKLKVKEGDVVYVKGSQGIRLEKAIKEILADKTKSSELLVRQEEEWVGR